MARGYGHRPKILTQNAPPDGAFFYPRFLQSQPRTVHPNGRCPLIRLPRLRPIHLMSEVKGMSDTNVIRLVQAEGEARCMQRFGVPGQLRLVYPAAA